jgi:hypothetical protein
MKTAMAIRGHPKPHQQSTILFTIVFHQLLTKLPTKFSATTYQHYYLPTNLTYHVSSHHFIIFTQHHPNFILYQY